MDRPKLFLFRELLFGRAHALLQRQLGPRASSRVRTREGNPAQFFAALPIRRVLEMGKRSWLFEEIMAVSPTIDRDREDILRCIESPGPNM